MVDSFVVDASVVAKWFNNSETYHREASLREAWTSGTVSLHSPALIIFEVANAIWENPNVESDQALSLARLLVRLSPKMIEIGDNESEEAMRLAGKTKHTFYDSFNVVMSKSREWPLITADTEQLELAKTYAKSLHISEINHILTKG